MATVPKFSAIITHEGRGILGGHHAHRICENGNEQTSYIQKEAPALDIEHCNSVACMVKTRKLAVQYTPLLRHNFQSH